MVSYFDISLCYLHKKRGLNFFSGCISPYPENKISFFFVLSCSGTGGSNNICLLWGNASGCVCFISRCIQSQFLLLLPFCKSLFLFLKFLMLPHSIHSFFFKQTSLLHLIFIHYIVMCLRSKPKTATNVFQKATQSKQGGRLIFCNNLFLLVCLLPFETRWLFSY